MVGTLLFRVAGATGGVLSARLLGPAGKGEYALVVLAGALLGLIGSSGIQFWAVRELARPGGVRPVADVLRRHLRRATSIMAGLTVVSLPILATAGLATPTMVVATGLLAMAMTASTLHLAVPTGLLHMRVVAATTLAGGLSFIAWVVALDLLGSASVTAAVVGVAVSHLVMVGLLRRRLSLPRPTRADDAELRTAYGGAVRFGLAANASELSSLAAFRFDIVLIGLLLTSTDVGYYAVAVSLAEMLWLVPDGVTQVVLPYAARNPDRRDTRRVIGLTVVVTAAAGLALCLLGEVAIRLAFGPSFAPAASALIPLVIASVAMGAWKVLAAEMVGRGRPGVRAASALSGLGLMVAADLMLIPRLGIVGAGLASAIGYLGSVVHILLAMRRRRCAGDGDGALASRAGLGLPITPG